MPTYPVQERSLVSSARKPVSACTVAVTASIRLDGDTSRVRLTAAYVTALESAGLIPLIVPPLSSASAAAAVMDSVSGLVLTGGEDVDPARYGEKRHEKVRSINAARDATEAALIVERPIAKAAANDKMRFMILNPRWWVRIRGLADLAMPIPGDRGLPGFYPAVHPEVTLPGGSSRTRRLNKPEP